MMTGHMRTQNFTFQFALMVKSLHDFLKEMWHRGRKKTVVFKTALLNTISVFTNNFKCDKQKTHFFISGPLMNDPHQIFHVIEEVHLLFAPPLTFSDPMNSFTATSN